MLEQEYIDKAKRLAWLIHPEHNMEGHIIPVVNIALELSGELNAQHGIVETAAYLHDAGRVKFGCRFHDRTGAWYTAIKLWEYDFPKQEATHIVQCVRTHRGTKEFPPKTLEAEIVANADALSHFEIALYEMGINYSSTMSFRKTVDWLERKLVYDFGHKLTLPKAKQMAQQKYEHNIKPLIESARRYAPI